MMAKVTPDDVQLVLKEPDSLIQAALLGQDRCLASQQGTIGAQLLGRQCLYQHLPQGPLAPRYVFLQLPGVLLLPLQEPESLQQRGLEPQGQGKRGESTSPTSSPAA